MKKKDHIRIIGDVHGHIADKKSKKTGRSYIAVANASDWSIQVGDMGFNYQHLVHSKLNPTNHRFFGGNHDNYDTITTVPHNLGDFGIAKVGGLAFFFCRGAFSIDKAQRLHHERTTGQKIWWKEEELTYAQGLLAIKAYETIRPRFVITHDCPAEVAKLIGSPNVLKAFGFEPDSFQTSTQNLLQAMFDIHEPELWVFGHFHKNWLEKVRDTTFVCVDELSHLTLNERGALLNNLEK